MPSDDATTVSGRPVALLAFERLGDDLDRDLLRAVEAAQGAVGDLLTRPSDVPVGPDPSLLPAARRLAGEWRALGRQAGDAGRRLETADAVDDRRAGGVGDVVSASAAGFGRGLARFAGGVVEGLVALGERQEDNRDIPWRLLGALRDGGLPGLLDRADHEVAHAARRDAGLLAGSVGQFVDTFVARNPLVGGVPYWSEQARRNGVAATIEAGAEYAGEALPEATLMAIGTKAKLPPVTRVEPVRAVVVPTAVPEGRRPADLHPGSAGASPANRAAFEHYLDELRRSMDKPHVEDLALAEIINWNYRPQAVVGSGSAADGYRHTRDTGELVGGSDHVTKVEHSIARLRKWIRLNPEARPGDRAAADNVLRDLQNAQEGR